MEIVEGNAALTVMVCSDGAYSELPLKRTVNVCRLDVNTAVRYWDPASVFHVVVSCTCPLATRLMVPDPFGSVDPSAGPPVTENDTRFPIVRGVYRSADDTFRVNRPYTYVYELMFSFR
jgi:hypothetical protein